MIALIATIFLLITVMFCWGIVAMDRDKYKKERNEARKRAEYYWHLLQGWMPNSCTLLDPPPWEEE